jgi:hypothetical protein
MIVTDHFIISGSSNDASGKKIIEVRIGHYQWGDKKGNH